MKKWLFLVLIALLASCSAKIEDSKELQILWTSDLHGSFSDWSYSVDKPGTGLGRVATKIKELKNNDTLLIDVGDTIQGNGTSVFHTTAWDNSPSNTEGLYPAITGFNHLGYDALVLGNHEFNFGIERLQKAYGLKADGTNGFNGKILTGNLYKDGKPVYDAFMVKKMGEDGPNVAIISMTHPNIMSWDKGNLEPYGYSTRPADEVTAETIAYLKSPQAEKEYGKIDLFLAIQHMSAEREYNKGDGASDVIAQNGKELTLFVGAHGHNNTATVIEGVPYGELRSNGSFLGQVLIPVVKKGGKWQVENKATQVVINHIAVPASGDQAVTADPYYMQAIAKADSFAKDYTNTVIGRLTGGPLVPEAELKGTYQAYLQANALTSLINDAMLYYTQDYGTTLAGTAPLDTNANARAGNLTRGNISTIYKYDNNTLSVVEMTGHQFKRWMEWSYLFIGNYKGEGMANFDLGPAMVEGDLTIPYGNGGFAGYNMDQFAGLNYQVDLTKPYGQRIINMTNLDGTPFNLDATYKVAVNNYRVDSQLSVNAGESSIPAINPVGTNPVTLIAREVDNNLTVNGVTKQNGEGMLGLMVDYIERAKSGVISNSFIPNWSYITPPIDPALRAKAVELVNKGMIDLKPVPTGDSGAVGRGADAARRAVKSTEVE